MAPAEVVSAQLDACNARDIAALEFMAVYAVHDGLIQAVWFFDPQQVSAPLQQA